MRVLVEALCAEHGGIRTYIDNLLQAWGRTYPDDELLVLVREGSTIDGAGHHLLHIPVRRPEAIRRPAAQTRAVRRAVRSWQPDAVLATLPSTTLLHPGVPTAVVVYDLRHELRPQQFSRRQRLLRRLSYSRGYRIADTHLSISRRSQDDLHRLHPALRATAHEVAYLGADHVLGWPTESAHGRAVTFGHHTNKNLPLVIDAWALAAATDQGLPPLTILGLGTSARADIQSRIDDLGIADRISLSPFLPEDEFQQTMAGASIIVFPSDFEGFGLPVVEAMTLEIPVVIGPEPATLEVAGGHAYVMEGWSPQALVAAASAACEMSRDERRVARQHAEKFTWQRTVEVTRAALHAAR